jgi:glycosyltransferase involved in cell wall biosynthesis
MSPLVTIITVNYNDDKKLQKTIESVVNQSFTDFEYIVVDGRSTDRSIDILKRYIGKINWVSEDDRGIYDAMNKGILLSSGTYLNFLNSGDCLIHNNILEEIFLDNHLGDAPDFIYGDKINVLADGERKYTLILHDGCSKN